MIWVMGMRVKDEDSICGERIWEAYDGYVIRSNNTVPQVYNKPNTKYDADPDAYIIQEWSVLAGNISIVSLIPS
jgi:hypothetical protein